MNCITKNIFLSITYLLISFSFFACSNFSYKSRGEFKAEKEEIRHEKIISILEKNDIKVDNKFQVIYIDYILTKSDRYSTVEKQFPTPDFKEFIEKAIPTLYYAYSLDNYKNAPSQWKQEAEKFIINHIPYFFNFGEKKFRESIAKDLEKEGSELFLLFTFYSEDNPEEAALGSKDNDNSYSLLSVHAWDKYFTFNDFKNLNPEQQGKLFLDEITMKLIQNRDWDEKIDESIRLLSRAWSDRSRFYLSQPQFTELSNTAPTNVVVMTMMSMLSKKNNSK